MSPRAFIVLLLASALVIRMGLTLALRDPHRFHGSQLGSDAVEYNQLALRVARGEGYVNDAGKPSSFRAPGFPLLLSLLYGVFGENYLAVYTSLAMLGALASLLAFLLASELLCPARARLAGLLAAVYFPHAYFATVFASENLFAVCIGLGLWLYLRYLKTERPAFLAAAGLALGCGTLTRTFAVLLLPLLALVVAWRDYRRHGVRWWSQAVFAVAFLAPVVPWTARNYTVHKAFVLVATNGGNTFYGGNNDLVLSEPAHWGGWLPTATVRGGVRPEAGLEEVPRDQAQWRLGMAWVRANLPRLPLLLVFKFGRLWLPELASGNRSFVVLQSVTYLPFLLLFVLAAVRSVRARRYRHPLWVSLHVAVLATVATALIFWGSPRFRDANAPLLMVYAAMEFPERILYSIRFIIPRRAPSD